MNRPWTIETASAPVENHRNTCLETQFNRAVLSSLLKNFAGLWIEMSRELDPNLKTGDFARRLRGHHLLNPGFAALEIPAVALGNDSHDRQDAGVQGCRHQIGGREALTPALVICWGIGFQG